MNLTPLIRFVVRQEPDIVTARQKTRRMAELLGFDSQDRARISTAVSELARNVYQYAGKGHIDYSFKIDGEQMLVIKVTDSGPGIANLSEVLSGTYVSSTGMGVGLIGSKKIMDFFDIVSNVGEGTQITIGKSLPKRTKRIEPEQLDVVLTDLSSKHVVSAFEEVQNQNRDLMTALEEVKAAKEELAELNRELAETNRGVVALYAELDEKALSLQKANEIKTSFLSNMTHEFRTPLSSVISLSWLLLNKVDGDLTSEQQKQVEYIKKSSETLMELVNNLLDIAKVEAGKVSVSNSEFNIQEVLGGLRGVFRPLMGNKNVTFDVFDPTFDFMMNSDEGKIAQILRNLVANAVKFTEAGSVTVSSKLIGVDVVEFEVRDTGIGIKKEDLDYIFEDFSQVETPLHKKQRGTGLGLPLSKKLAGLLGGDIFVESTIGEGTVFRFRVPRNYCGDSEKVLITSEGSQNGTNDEENSPAQNLDNGEKFKVLLIDDDESSRYVLKNLVKNELDAVFWEASSGAVGLDVIEKWKPDLVFLDLSMPEIDGFEILVKLREEKRNIDVPVIVNSAKKLNDFERKFLNDYSTPFISKERRDEVTAIKDLRQALSHVGVDYKVRD
jgi:Signal transduction histidine kinase